MRILFLISFVILFMNGYSQRSAWIDNIASTVVSIGKDTIIYIRDHKGLVVKKRVFETLGTGVIFYTKKIVGRDTIVIPIIVTAKHVFFNPAEKHNPRALNVRFRWDDKKPLDKYFGVKLELVDGQNNTNWIAHPDSTVDLACLPLSPHLDSSIVGVSKLPILPYNMITSLEKCFEVQEVFAIGFPGIGGLEYATKPIIRKGAIAWISPQMPDKTPFLIDCDIFPGNSGGPIFIQNSGVDKYGDIRITGEISFIGIVSKRLVKINPIVSENFPIFRDAKGGQVFSQESFSLGVVEPAERVRELLEHTRGILNK